MTTKNPGNVVMMKKSADAGSTSRTLPQIPAPLAPPLSKSSIHPLLEEQLLEVADMAGKTRLRKLVEIGSRQYELYESDRSSLETVIRLTSDEATAATERLEHDSVARLQAILDHVKGGLKEGRVFINSFFPQGR